MGEKTFNAGLVPLYLQLYDDINPDLRNSFQKLIRNIEEQLEKSAGVTVSPIITTANDVDAMTKLFHRKNIDAVYILHLAYSPSLLIADALKQLNKPIVLISTSMASSFSYMNEEYLMQNHGIHGVMDLASVLQSMYIPYQIVAGYHLDSAFKKELAASVRILQAVQAFRNQRIGLTGAPFPLMGDFLISFDFLDRRFGIKVVNIPEEDIVCKQSEIAEDLVRRKLEEDRNIFNCDSVDDDTHQLSVRGYLALRQLAEERELSAYTMSYLDIKRIPVPFYAVNRLMSESFGYAGEGDVLTASLGKAMNILAPKAMFTEFFCPDWENNLVILSHMGEIDPRFSRSEVRGKLVVKKALGSELNSIYHQFPVQNIALTFICFAKTPEMDVKVVFGLLDVVDHPLFDYFYAPHFVAQPKIGLPDLLREYSMLGGGHHMYVAEGDITSEIKKWCQYLRIQPNEIKG